MRMRRVSLAASGAGALDVVGVGGGFAVGEGDGGFFFRLGGTVVGGLRGWDEGGGRGDTGLRAEVRCVGVDGVGKGVGGAGWGIEVVVRGW